MTYAELSDFLQHEMQMSHIYQPVMVLALLRSGGRATKRQLAREILNHDESQLEYYDQVVSGMVGRILRNHRVVDRTTGEFHLIGFDQLTAPEINTLIELCEQKVEAYKAKRGDAIWQHRDRSLRVLSGTVRYEVLKQAKFRCTLCGISAEEKALEVDHIRPRNDGGTDEISNLQALCYSCNAAKRDRDATDFRNNRTLYDHRISGCPFCEIDDAFLLGANSLAACLLDRFPVTPLHSLIVPKRHVEDYFSLVPAERNACESLLAQRKIEVLQQDREVTGFNIGVNNGADAGQTISHVHLHLIPRRHNDHANPRGGVRCVIPNKANY